MSVDPQSRASTSSASQLPPGIVLGGRYEIVETADEAAFGTLYKAKRRADGVIVTVQVLDSRLFGEQRVRAAVRAELEALRGLEHKNLAVPLDLGDEMLQTGTITWIVYEHLDGQSLIEMHTRKRGQGRPFSLKGAYNVIAHATNGLIALSSPGLGSSGLAERGFHGALSMRSIHVSSSGRVKILELGLARALLSSGARAALGQAVPTVAPETISQPSSVDARVDVYAIGAIFYELMTGQAPASPPTPPSTFVEGIPRSLDIFLDKCLRAVPADRFAEMSRVKESLQSSVGPEAGAPVTTSTPVAGTPSASTPAASASATGPVVSSAPPPRAAPPPRPAAPPPRPAPPAAAPPPPSPPRAAPPPGPPLPGTRPSAQQPAVPRSFNVDSALSTTDEAHERWLIQKDKLDFGPFNLRDVKAQIETGKILAEHTIVDTESGERRRVKDHPQLRELVISSEAQRFEHDRLRTEQADRSKHRGRMFTMLLILVLIAAGGGGGALWYVKHMKPAVIVQKEVVESDLKFEISMKVDPPEKKTPGKRTSHKNAQGKNVFDDSTVLGDASEGGGDETLDGPTVQRVMTQNFKVLVGCVKEERGRNAGLHNVDMDFIIKGTGSVSAVKVNGQTTGPFAGCMYGKMQTIAFPKFNGSKTHASFSLALK